MFPFSQLGLQCNPFRVLEADEWAAIAVIHPAIRNAIQKSKTHIQIMGQQGRGKSTTLRGLQRLLQDRNLSYEYLARWQRRYYNDLAGLDVFLLDEAQRLLWTERWRLLKSARQKQIRLIVSSHTNLHLWFRLFQMPLLTLNLDHLDQQESHLRYTIEQRLSYFSIQTASYVIFDPEAIDWLEDEFGSNYRSIQYFLYELFQLLVKYDLSPSAEHPLLITSDLLVTTQKVLDEQYHQKMGHQPVL